MEKETDIIDARLNLSGAIYNIESAIKSLGDADAYGGKEAKAVAETIASLKSAFDSAEDALRTVTAIDDGDGRR